MCALVVEKYEHLTTGTPRPATCRRARYAMSGTCIAYAAICLRDRYAMSSTDTYHMLLSAYAVCGTGTAYGCRTCGTDPAYGCRMCGTDLAYGSSDEELDLRPLLLVCQSQVPFYDALRYWPSVWYIKSLCSVRYSPGIWSYHSTLQTWRMVLPGRY